MKHSYKLNLRKKPIITDELKEKMQKGRLISTKIIKRHTKPVLQIDPSTNKIINEFNSIKEASIFMNCNPSTISDVAGGKKKRYLAKGYIWKYKIL